MNHRRWPCPHPIRLNFGPRYRGIFLPRMHFRIKCWDDCLIEMHLLGHIHGELDIWWLISFTLWLGWYQLPFVWCWVKSGTKKKKTTKARGLTFTTHEDVLLCQAWLATSMDPICGTKQKGTKRWRKKIHKHDHEHKTSCRANCYPFHSQWGLSPT